MNVQTYVGHVVQMLAGNEPDDLADLTLGIMAGDARKSVGVNLLVLCQLRHVLEGGAFCVRKKSTRAVFIERVEFRLAHHLFDRERATDIHAETANVDLHHVLAGEQDSLRRQCQLLVELADLGVEHAKCGRQPRTMDFYRGQHSAELLARKVIGQFLYQSLRTFDWRKEWVHRWSHLGNQSSICSFLGQRKLFKQNFSSLRL